MATPRPVSVAFQSDLLGTRMVGIGLKASLSTGERFQVTLGVQGPVAASLLLGRFSRQRSFPLFRLLSCSLDLIAQRHFAVAINGQSYDAEIHADEIGRSSRRAIRRLNGHEQQPLAVLAPEEIALAGFSGESLGLGFPPDDRNEEPAFARQPGDAIRALESHPPRIVRDAGGLLEAGAVGCVPAVSFADLGDTTDDQLSGESEVLAQLAVGAWLKFDLVSGLEAEGFAGEPIGSRVESPHSGRKLCGLIPIGQQLRLQGQLHEVGF